jgi:hypothetical protein
MLFECWLQLRGNAGPAQIASIAQGKNKALTHNLGGGPRMRQLRQRGRTELD